MRPPTPRVELRTKRAKVCSGTLEIALQRIVCENQGIAQIVEKVAYRVAHRLGQRRPVGLGDGHQHVAVDHLVEIENLAVGVFERVVELLFRRGGLRSVRLRGASRKDNGEDQETIREDEA